MFLREDGSAGVPRAHEGGVARSGDGGGGNDAHEGEVAAGDEAAAAGPSPGPASRALAHELSVTNDSRCDELKYMDFFPFFLHMILFVSYELPWTC